MTDIKNKRKNSLNKISEQQTHPRQVEGTKYHGSLRLAETSANIVLEDFVDRISHFLRA